MKLIQALLISLFLLSCSQIQKKGYDFELSSLSDLKAKINDRQDVLRAMGEPTLKLYDDQGQENWVYFSEERKKFWFFNPKVDKREIVLINFNKEQVIADIADFSLSDQQKIAFNSKETTVESKDISWWRSLFGNIGQVRAN